MPLVWKFQMERRRERRNLPSFCGDRGLRVLLRGGKELFLRTCSALPSEVSAPAGGEAGWAAGGAGWEGALDPSGNVLSLQGTSCPGQVAPGTQGQSCQGGTSLLKPCPQCCPRGELPGDTRGD